MPWETIISTKELSEHIHDPNWIVVDCRFDLMDPSWGEEEYRSLHIPGAVYAHIDKDLSGPITPQTGRHPMPDPAKFYATLARLGINNKTQVIAYDATSGSFAARLWFLLRYFGHTQVAVLDGGLSAWLSAGFPTSSGWEEKPAGKFVGQPHPERIVSTAEVESIHLDPHWLLVDSRAHERFIGAQETIDSKAGHIPGAIDRFYGLNSNPDGTFRSGSELREEFIKLLAGHTVKKTVIYCGSGVTSAHNLLAMAIAGLPQAKLYAGSWSEWIRDPKHAIATGE
ncbi:MAG: sulfurtransferase [Anaerolineaceae bacterium]|nr:sulfurtransferase [Anaerolineaceae bacterium]